MASSITPLPPSPSRRPPLQSRDVADAIDACLSAAERDPQGRLSLRNMPTQENRTLLAARARVLVEAFKQHDRKEIAIAIMDMLSAYDVAQARAMTAAERKAAATIYVRELDGVPTWAVAEACHRIRLGTAPDISHAFKPTPIQVRVLALNFAQPWRAESLRIAEILTAPRHVDGPSDAERKAVGIKMRTLADELKEGSHQDPEVAERESRERKEFLRRCEAGSQREIERQWASLGRKLPEFVVSVSLLKLLNKEPA